MAFWNKRTEAELRPENITLNIQTVVFNVSVISESVHEPATAIVAFDHESLKKAGAELVLNILGTTKELEQFGLHVSHDKVGGR